MTKANQTSGQIISNHPQISTGNEQNPGDTPKVNGQASEDRSLPETGDPMGVFHHQELATETKHL